MKIKLSKSIVYKPWHASVAMPRSLDIKNTIIRTIEIACGHRFDALSFGVSSAFVDSKTIKRYNLEYRGKDSSTDVLSFPEFDFEQQKWDEVFLSTKSSLFYLGDIIISYQNVIDDAKHMSWSASERVLHLIAHSVLHLLGFDHIEEEERIVMESLETLIMTSLGMKDPFS